MFRLPWWVRKWLKDKFNIDSKSAEQKKLVLSVGYLASAFIFANYIILNSGTPGISKEDEKLLSTSEKVLLTMNPPEVKVIKYKLGVGVTSEQTLTQEEIKAAIDKKRSEATAAATAADFS
ncbi:hypothetical protein WDU94_013255 [Cyamophila willieti]